MLRCSACPISATPFITVEELEVHIAADHVNYVPYECEKCRFSKFPTEFALVSHCMNDHGLKEFYVRYKVTPETEKKRALVKELLQKSLLISGGNDTSRPTKRKRPCAVEVVHSSTSALSPCSSLESEENQTNNELDKPTKSEFDKDGACENDADVIERSEGQHVVVAASGEITLASNNYPVITSVGELFPNSSGSFFDFGLKNFDSLGDLSHTFLAQESLSHQTNKTRRRPPRTCTICGLQVTGQRSSLVYHANSKHLKLPLFHCRQCNKTWSTVTKSDIIKHVKAVHNGDDSGIEDYRSQHTDQIRAMTDKCFPAKNKGVNEDEEVDTAVTTDPLMWLNNDETPSTL
ncbi:unnamed protein product [Enterobius vermicularis]|uniref:C2H2-type domain-containing protein n=1 Tax=Enterobius vermicularis TaxID=51028 RepID=A0A0N4VCM2_ENTVE|nr:unnamed protein product [Enterobius vermicularis]